MDGPSVEPVERLRTVRCQFHFVPFEGECPA